MMFISTATQRQINVAVSTYVQLFTRPLSPLPMTNVVITAAVPPPTASLEGGGAAPCTASVIRGVLEAEQVAGLHEERVVGAIVPVEPEAARELERLREPEWARVSITRTVSHEQHRAGIGLVREEEVSAEEAALAGDRDLIGEAGTFVIGDDRTSRPPFVA